MMLGCGLGGYRVHLVDTGKTFLYAESDFTSQLMMLGVLRVRTYESRNCVILVRAPQDVNRQNHNTLEINKSLQAEWLGFCLRWSPLMAWACRRGSYPSRDCLRIAGTRGPGDGRALRLDDASRRS
jgi:hypothetical protein